MIIEQLKEFGLSDKETKVYLTLLELGPASVQETAKTSKLNRSTTYVTLESLLKKELINMTDKSGTRIYTAISPELLIEKTTELIEKHSKIMREIETIIPDLQSLSKSLKRRPRVLFFEGIEGIKSIHEGVLNCPKGTIVRTFSKPNFWENLIPGYYSKITKKMSEKGIEVKAIQPTESRRITSKNTGIDVLYIPGDKYTFSADLSVYENKVILISAQDQYGVIIENEDIAYTTRELFDLAWEEAQRIDGNN